MVENKRSSEGDLSEEAARAFQGLHEVLRGGARPSAEGLSKMWFILLGGAFEQQAGANDASTWQSDAESTCTGFVLHFAPLRRRRPQFYFPAVAPAMVGDLMTQAGLTAITKPIVVGLPAENVPSVSKATHTVGFPAWRRGPRLVWIVPGAEMVKLFVRNGPDGPRPWWREPASNGPLAIPAPLPDWESAVLFSSVPMPCPHCSVTSSRQRQLEDGVLVCPECARSFKGTAGA